MRILVIGRGFVAQAVIRHLTEAGHAVRVLVPAGEAAGIIPTGVSVDAVVASAHDVRGIRAALVGIDAAVFIPGPVVPPAGADLLKPIQAARALAEAAADAELPHILHLSTLGAEPGSAYPFAKTAGVAEVTLKRSGVPLTILRTGIPFGKNDNFTTAIAHLLSATPILPLPKGGATTLHPIWVEDLAAAMALSVETPPLTGQKTLEIGGAEHLTLREIVETVAAAAGKKRPILNVSFVTARRLTNAALRFRPDLPLSPHWLDYLAADRTAPVDTLPREFGLLPERLGGKVKAWITRS